MPGSHIEITIRRVIPAELWRVLRQVTKIHEFPVFVPCVKEVTVLERRRHVMKTRWRIEVDKIPISWIEEDTIVFKENAIYFNAVEGDLEEFKGKWAFQEHPEGTELTVAVSVHISIPAIQEHAEIFLKSVLTKNFEAIVSAVEQRLISTRYANYRKGDTDSIAGFGVIGHFYNFNHLEKCLKMLHPGFKMPSREFIGQLFSTTPSFKLQDIKDFRSKTGQAVDGCAIVATFIPEMIEKDMWAVFSKVVKACKVAEKHGVGVVALGGFTSIVGERIGEEISRQVDVPVTTGNTFTAAMALEGVFKALRLLGRDPRSLRAAVIGGTGDIGSACARVLIDTVKHLTITGRTKANLKKMHVELSRKRKAHVSATMDNRLAVKNADIVIAVASATHAIIDPSWLKSGAVVCDVGYPKNISHAHTERQDLLIFSGGLAKIPTPVTFPVDIGLPASDVLYGCFSEAIILSLEKRFENYSFGRGNITPERIAEIRDLGAKHGFEVSDFYWGEKLVDETLLLKIKAFNKF